MRTKTRWLLFAAPVLSLLVASGVVHDGVAAPETGQVEIIRDEFGEPHVFGSSPASVWYAVGYAVGQDRLWQADLLRRTGNGSQAEYFGPGAVPGDVFARTLFGPEARRAALFATARPETRVIFQSFADGLNAWIAEATASGQLPIEYAALGLSPPRAWVVDDSLALMLFLLWNFGEFGGFEELENAADLEEFVARFGPAEGVNVFLDTHWLNDPDASTTDPADGAVGTVRRGAAPKAELPPGLGAGAQAGQAALESNAARAGLRRGQASNAVAISPALSADGRALLLGGPQMGYSAPQINHGIGIHGAGFDVTGMQIAGLPGVLIGVAKEHAWTLTSGISDNTDLYVEVLNPADPSQYLFRGEWLDLDCRTETFSVRGAPDVDQQICQSVHGPIVGGFPGVAISRRTASRGREMQSLEALHDVSRVKSYEELREALRPAAHNFNLLYADAQGNIAHQHIGMIPIRAAGDNPWLPHDGTGPAEWQGFIPFEEMPRSLNPDEGWLVNWNNKPSPEWNNSGRGFGVWGPVQRVNTLIDLLEQVAPGSATVETVAEINRKAGFTTDTPSGNASFVAVSTLLGTLLGHVDTAADARLPGIVALLSTWDWLQEDENGDQLYDNPSVSVFNTWWEELVARVFADDLGGRLERNTVGNMAYRLLVTDPALPLLHDYLGGETVGDAVTGSLVTALDALEARFSSTDPADWLQAIAEIEWSPLGAGSVPNTIWMNRGTYNQIVHLGKGPELFARNVISPGQSGNPFDPHFADQLALYATWTYKPMRLDRPSLLRNTESVIRLRP
jgi:penicillin amidase